MSGGVQLPVTGTCDVVSQGAKWFALTTMSRHERLASVEINARGIETFLPTITETHYWSDRRKQVQVPLFRGYLFIRAEMRPDIRRAVSSARGIVAFLAMGGHPVPIPNEQIAVLQQLVKQNVPCTPHPFLSIGQHVRIRGGALDGIHGILVRYESGNRLVISVNSIERSLAISVEGYQVEAVSNYRHS